MDDRRRRLPEQDEAIEDLLDVASVVATPVAGWAAAPALLDPVAPAAGVGVGIASSVIPYVCDQLAMATVVGVAVLAQLPSPAEAAGVGLVVAGVALHRGPG